MKKMMILMCAFTSLFAKNTFAEDKCSNNFTNAKIINTTINNIVIQCGSENISIPVVKFHFPYITKKEDELSYIADKFLEILSTDSKILYLDFTIDIGTNNTFRFIDYDEYASYGPSAKYPAGFTFDSGYALYELPMMDNERVKDYDFYYQINVPYTSQRIKDKFENVGDSSDSAYTMIFPKKRTSTFEIRKTRAIYGSGLVLLKRDGSRSNLYIEFLPIEATGAYLQAYENIDIGENEFINYDYPDSLLEDLKRIKQEDLKLSKKIKQEKKLLSKYPNNSINSTQECNLIVASRKTLPEVREYIYENIKDRRHLKIFEASNGWYAISIGTLKPHEEKPVMHKWKISGKIPLDSFCASNKKLIREVNWK